MTGRQTSQATPQPDVDEASFEERLEGALRDSLPGFVELLQASRLTGGASKEMYRVVVSTEAGEKTLALRRNWGEAKPSRPGRGVTLSALLVEAELMRRAGEAGIPSPAIELVLQGDDARNHGLGEVFFMEWVDGETLGGRIAKAPHLAGARAVMARQCGDILGRLQQIDIQRDGLSERLHEYTAAEVVEQTYEGYLALEMPVPTIDHAAQWLRAHLPPVVPPALVHGDFRSGNVIVDEKGIAAVLDWENAGLGDPLRDLAWVCVNSWRYGVSEKPVGGFGEIDDLFAGYEAHTGEPVDRDAFHFWQVFGSFWWACTTLRLASSYRDGTVRSSDRVVIGRRCSEAEIDLVNLLVPGPLLPDAEEAPATSELASIPELVESVRDSLEQELLPGASGREKFLVLVALQSLGIVHRQLTLGPETERLEVKRISALVGASPDTPLQELRRRLCECIREGSLGLEDEALQRHLRHTVVARIRIDQPRYSGLREAQRLAEASS